MADYHPLIARAVEGLGTGSGEARRSLYERARAALVSQLRGIDPPLSEADITRERLALEDAIRKVEAEAVRRSRAEPRPAPPPLRPNPPAPRTQAPPPPPPPPAQPAPPPRRERVSPPFGEAPPVPRPEMQRTEPPPLRGPSDFPADEADNPSAQPSARSRLLNARTSPVTRDGLKGFRNVVNEVDDLGAASAQAAKSARDTRDSYGSPSPQQYADDDELPSMRGRVEPRFADGQFRHPRRCAADALARTVLRHGGRRRGVPAARRADQARDFRRITTRNRGRHGPIAAWPSSCADGDHFRRPRRHDLLAVDQHHAPLSVLLSPAVAANPDGTDADGGAEIPRARAAGSGREPIARRRYGEQPSRPRRRATRRALSGRRRTIPRASNLSVPPSGAPIQCRPAPGSRRNSKCARTSRFPSST